MRITVTNQLHLDYGRSFTLTDSSCNTPDGSCTFSGGAKEGPCSGASGILTLQEIRDIIKEKDLTPVHDLKAGVKCMSSIMFACSI
jgi:chitinase